MTDKTKFAMSARIKNSEDRLRSLKQYTQISFKMNIYEAACSMWTDIIFLNIGKCQRRPSKTSFSETIILFRHLAMCPIRSTEETIRLLFPCCRMLNRNPRYFAHWSSRFWRSLITWKQTNEIYENTHTIRIITTCSAIFNAHCTYAKLSQ